MEALQNVLLIRLPVQTDLVLSANLLIIRLLRNPSDPGGEWLLPRFTGASGCSLNSGSLLFAEAI